MVQPSEPIGAAFGRWVREHRALFFAGMFAMDLVIFAIALTISGVITPASWF